MGVVYYTTWGKIISVWTKVVFTSQKMPLNQGSGQGVKWTWFGVQVNYEEADVALEYRQNFELTPPSGEGGLIRTIILREVPV